MEAAHVLVEALIHQEEEANAAVIGKSFPGNFKQEAYEKSKSGYKH